MMKRFFLLSLCCFVLVSCGSTKMEREAMQTFKGNWILTDISYPNNSGFVDVKIFNDAPVNCFRNSTWHFVSNNNQGDYTLSGNDCPSGKQNFTWNVVASENNPSEYNLTLKPIGEDENSRRIDSGFRMTLSNLSQNKMTWRQTVQYEGEAFVIQMKFVKKY
jgi:hypothetical protein